jgi:hypothetical protein
MGGLGRATHAFPGEHFLIVRPLRDDVRRSVVDLPRRSRRVRSRQRRKDTRTARKPLAQLTRDTHKGRAAKTQQNSSTGRAMPATAKSRPMGSNSEVRMSHISRPKPAPLKDTGFKVHRPRLLNPHAPRAYHVLPIRRASEFF